MDAHLRISDAEREQAAAALGEHFAQGRLTNDEHAERLDRIWAARTRGDLVPVFRDLPDGALPAQPRTPRGGPPAYWASGFRRRGPLPPPILLVLAVLVVLTVVTHVPFVLIGLGVLLFVSMRRRAHWHPR